MWPPHPQKHDFVLFFAAGNLILRPAHSAVSSANARTNFANKLKVKLSMIAISRARSGSKITHDAAAFMQQGMISMGRIRF